MYVLEVLFYFLLWWKPIQLRYWFSLKSGSLRMYIFNSKIAISEFDDVLEPQRRILLAKPFIFASIVDFITDY